ncbi:putative inner membrane protein [Pelotomaculum schinkii]|uniref:Putative inner membrane protein n=1 Tax=Pelotomaculum schinkii TaxID=78350 RepID=A0A4Y7R605_9FIRM|nr:putative inner membrane protein [Pelotomaculum schinkii]
MMECLKKPWTYWVGGVLLGVLNVVLLALSGTVWQVTGGFLLWGAGALELAGFEPFKWEFFKLHHAKYGEIILNHNIFINKYTILNVGVIVGSLLATLLASQFKIGKAKNIKQVVFALIGGIMMGYGARLAAGCNIGSFFSGIPSFSLHAWVFWIFVVLGAWLGTKILIKYLL